MDQDQKNLTGMFDTVAGYFDKNTSLWNGTPAFVKAVTDLKNGIAAIDAEGNKQATPTTGQTGVKTNARDVLEDDTQEIADQLSALAADINDPDLGAKVTMTRSSLDQATGDDLLTTAKRVVQLATTNLAALEDYGITAANVTALQTAITTFEPLKDAPRVAIAGRAGSTATLPGLITATRGILRNRIDKMMTPFRKKNPQFYAGYQAARVIVNRGGTAPPPTPPAAPQK